MISDETMTHVYKLARANKRTSADAVDFELHYEMWIHRLVSAINNREYRCDKNYTFISTDPKPREVFGCEMETRLVQWYIIWRILPIVEQTLTDRTFNNRVGMGTDAAIECVRQDFIEVSQYYTREAWYIQWDLQGYFPNANCDIACKQLQKLVEEHYHGDDKEDLLWMIMIAVHANPQRHCYRKSPRPMWSLIEEGKSLFEKEAGTGGAIGFLIWQIGMNLYLNDVDHWLIDDMGLRLVRFVDDNVITVLNKEMGLALLPLIRKKYEEYGIKMHPKKFNCQSVHKGIHFLGSYIKYERVYVHNRTIKKAVKRIVEYNKSKNKPEVLFQFLSSTNSIFGILKSCGRSEYNNIKKMRDKISMEWYTYVYFDEERLCLSPLRQYKYVEMTGSKYYKIITQITT